MSEAQPTQQHQQKRRYVARILQRHEIPHVARIAYDAFNDPNNTTPDEMSVILESEVDPDAGRKLSRDEKIAKRSEDEYKLFDKQNSFYVGAYLLPASSSSEEQEETIPSGQGELISSETLPAGSTLAGVGIWFNYTPTSPPEAPEKQQKADKEPTLLNRFFAQMYTTRETIMKGKTYWFLKLLVIDPAHQRKGVGSLLLGWGTHKADKDHVDAWLESSPMGKNLYIKSGFKVLGMDRVEEKRASKGYIEWPYMIHEHAAAQ